MSADDHEPTTLGAAVRRALEEHATELGMTVDELCEEVRKDYEAGERYVEWLRGWGFDVGNRFEAAELIKKGQNFQPGRQEGALSPFTQWIEDYLRRNPRATNKAILRRLRYDEPRVTTITTNDPDQTGVAFDGDPIPKKRLRERARECRKRLGIRS